MNLHANSRTCPHTRRLLCLRVVEEGWKVRDAAEAAGCSSRTAAQWLARSRAGDRLLCDRSSRPRLSPSRLPQQRVRAIAALRRLRITAAEIAEVLAIPLSTVSLWLLEKPAAEVRLFRRLSTGTGRDARRPTRQIHPHQ